MRFPPYVLVLTALGLIALGGFLITVYGKARYDAGYNQCESEQSKAVIKEDLKRNEKRSKARVKVAKSDDIDCELFNNNWLREPNCK